MTLERLAVTCGGTGGHFYPGLSVAREFKSRGGEVLLLLSGVHAAEQKKVAESFGIAAVALPKMPDPKKSPLKFLWGLAGGFFAAVRELRKFDAQALLGMGSFATTPPVFAAVVLRIPLFLHDGNARIGKANRIFSRFARKTGTAFPAVNLPSSRCPVLCTGMPVRPELRKMCGLTRNEALKLLNERFRTAFVPELPVFLITGGSQGAAIFNTVLPEVLNRREEKFQVIHLTGKGKMDDALKGYGCAGIPKLILESCSEMELCLSAADLVFSRSGGSTAAELALFGKSSVLIPYPYAAEGHQMDNARYFAGQNAAIVIENSAFNIEAAHELLDDFFSNPEKWRKMGEAMGKMAIPAAAELMLSEISDSLD
ncbi:MAG: UDP-N-acetylglucosamine--N-acetylmuramyl-(pentapeptide) pyrophosphoryl-undecaprenol N-acetylglucosamine transferase [Lentisphaeria bacterium]|nr:UDP-N-acetylglucosamine--N-acetylmuramyl-(pentapeptide) pyrophosphoryl-undecaprenol N-acetylglucosamine transferase [Lentisphaeria bacterium]